MKTNINDINELEQQKSELVAIFKSTLNRLSSLILINELGYSEASKLIDEEANKLDKKLKIKEEQNQNNNSIVNKFIDNSHKIIDVDNQTFELIPEFSHFYWGPQRLGFSSWHAYMRAYIPYNNLNNLLNNNSCLFASLDLSSELKKQENAIKTISVGLTEFALIESENQHAFITHTNDLLKVGQIITIFNPSTDKSIIVEIDKITKSKHNQFINEFSLVDFY